jgi:hypothetical protein
MFEIEDILMEMIDICNEKLNTELDNGDRFYWKKMKERCEYYLRQQDF